MTYLLGGMRIGYTKRRHARPAYRSGDDMGRKPAKVFGQRAANRAADGTPWVWRCVDTDATVYAVGIGRSAHAADVPLYGVQAARVMSKTAGVGHALARTFLGIGQASTGMPRRSLISIAFSNDGERSPVKSW